MLAPERRVSLDVLPATWDPYPFCLTTFCNMGRISYISQIIFQNLFIRDKRHFSPLAILIPPRTLLQLSHPKYEFWAAKNVTCLPFSLLFSGHLYKNHSAETWGLGCLFLDYSQPGYLCGLLPTDHPLRPGSHQWTHSTALSLFRWPEQLILSKMNRWVFFFESHAMLAHQTNRSRFYYPKLVRKMRH